MEQDAFEVLHLIRSMKNAMAPINRVPPEVLILTPDFLDECNRPRDTITLTHVCQAWRQIFISRSSLWTDFHCMDADKTHVYLERSKSSPIRLRLSREGALLPNDPFFELVPDAICRLRSLTIEAAPEHLQNITNHLESRPAPLLEELSIYVDCELEPRRHPVLVPALLGGDLPSLRKLRLHCVRTKLSWRNMANLTSFELDHTSPGEISLTQLLDFFESAPHLLRVELNFVTLDYDAQNGRLVSLPCLKSFCIYGEQPTSPLLDHLLIPAGVELTLEVDLPHSLVEDLLPRSLDNLRNLSHFALIQIAFNDFHTYISFGGPNGHVGLLLPISEFDATRIALESLALFDTSKTEWLVLRNSNPLSGDLLYKTLKPMKNLRSLAIFQSRNLSAFFRVLDPDQDSPGVLVCPELEELNLEFDREKGFDVESMVSMTAARASRGAKLKSVRITSCLKSVPTMVLELRKHVLHVEHKLGSGGDVENDSDESGEED